MSMFGGDVSYYSGSLIFVYYVVTLLEFPLLLSTIVHYFIVVDIDVVLGIPDP